ncbi:GGDEF domain-containing protein [Paucibacter sp. DJ1R-11]|uniref:GGDEF domain-containing protein n=1 Tax=Paucibacter sp. DJ1R-11 TaxID=2893556 RepID=UPI0021E4719B|nr:GGDEF domain-containing protein [Paucibacter sp. DJ1R-11]MCV2361864.1 GGDEF domain-containing protein [Paucibacter sp. DJ1R-11]
MRLDVPTLFAVVTLVALLMAGWICFMAWGKPARDALWAWGLALLAYAGSHVLFAMLGPQPLASLVIGGNLAYSVALSLMLLALRRFDGLDTQAGPPLLVQLQLFAPVLAIVLLYLLLMDQYAARVVAGSLTFSLQIVFILRSLLDRRMPRHGRGRYILLTAFFALLASLLLRSLAAAMGWMASNDDDAGRLWLTMVFVVALCAVISISLGFVYMTMERAELRNFELAMKDMLTGLSNRRAISDQLHMAVSRAQRQGQYLSVLMLDIDHFKRVNDGYGHQAGDAVLRGVAHTLLSRLRAQDQIGRFGGEEFLLMLPDTSLEGAATLAEALRQAVEATPTQWGAHRISVTISIGVAGGVITGAVTVDGLVAAADSAMYRAKQSGRNRCEVAPPLLAPN